VSGQQSAISGKHWREAQGAKHKAQSTKYKNQRPKAKGQSSWWFVDSTEPFDYLSY
jgi:hypothetical protein